jgi:large subunit ribosomal protein L10
VETFRSERRKEVIRLKKPDSEPRSEKVKVVEEVARNLGESKSAIVTGNAGLTVEEVTELRARLFKEQVELHVVKNTLALRALKKAGMDGLDEWFKGPTAIAMAKGDALASSRVLTKFVKDHEKLTIKGGWMDGRKISSSEIKALASLPSREVLLAKMLGSLQAPVRGTVQVLAGPLRKLVYALNAVKELKAKAA